MTTTQNQNGQQKRKRFRSEVTQQQLTQFLSRPAAKVENLDRNLRKSYMKGFFKKQRFNDFRELKQKTQNKEEDSVESELDQNDSQFTVHNDQRSRRRRERLRRQLNEVKRQQNEQQSQTQPTKPAPKKRSRPKTSKQVKKQKSSSGESDSSSSGSSNSGSTSSSQDSENSHSTEEQQGSSGDSQASGHSDKQKDKLQSVKAEQKNLQAETTEKTIPLIISNIQEQKHVEREEVDGNSEKQQLKEQVHVQDKVNQCQQQLPVNIKQNQVLNQISEKIQIKQPIQQKMRSNRGTKQLTQQILKEPQLKPVLKNNVQTNGGRNKQIIKKKYQKKLDKFPKQYRLLFDSTQEAEKMLKINSKSRIKKEIVFQKSIKDKVKTQNIDEQLKPKQQKIKVQQLPNDKIESSFERQMAQPILIEEVSRAQKKNQLVGQKKQKQSNHQYGKTFRIQPSKRFYQLSFCSKVIVQSMYFRSHYIISPYLAVSHLTSPYPVTLPPTQAQLISQLLPASTDIPPSQTILRKRIIQEEQIQKEPTVQQIETIVVEKRRSAPKRRRR